MCMRISHPGGYLYVSPAEVPNGFYVKCYPVCVYDENAEDGRGTAWETDYDLDRKSIRGFLRYERFGSFEEACVRCAVLGLACRKCRFLAMPPEMHADGSWGQYRMIGLHPDGWYVPEDEYEMFKAEREGEYHFREWEKFCAFERGQTGII